LLRARPCTDKPQPGALVVVDRCLAVREGDAGLRDSILAMRCRRCPWRTGVENRGLRRLRLGGVCGHTEVDVQVRVLHGRCPGLLVCKTSAHCRALND
jgi:hypothetical protein